MIEHKKSKLELKLVYMIIKNNFIEIYAHWNNFLIQFYLTKYRNNLIK